VLLFDYLSALNLIFCMPIRHYVQQPEVLVALPYFILPVVWILVKRVSNETFFRKILGNSRLAVQTSVE